nr:heterogeneous nuclear ribonucleoprotein 1-like [Ipomoea batatas]
MDSDQGKLFIGGISWETNEDKLREYFQSYGEVMQTVVMRDKISGKPRGFGFVVFADPSVLDTVLQDRHTIDGRTVRMVSHSNICFSLILIWIFDVDFLEFGF